MSTQSRTSLILLNCVTTVSNGITMRLDKPIFSLEKSVEFERGGSIDPYDGLHARVASSFFKWPQISKLTIDADSITIELYHTGKSIANGLAMDFNEELSDILFQNDIGIPDFKLVIEN